MPPTGRGLGFSSFHMTPFYGNRAPEELSGNISSTFHMTPFYGNFRSEKQVEFWPCAFHTTPFYGNSCTCGGMKKMIDDFPHDTVLRKHVSTDRLQSTDTSSFHTTPFYGNGYVREGAPCWHCFPHDTVLRKLARKNIRDAKKLTFHTTPFYGNSQQRSERRSTITSFHTTPFYGNALKYEYVNSSAVLSTRHRSTETLDYFLLFVKQYDVIPLFKCFLLKPVALHSIYKSSPDIID